MDKNTRKGIALALLAAALYALNAPFSKLLLDSMPPVLAAGFLYIGAGIGMALLALVRKISGRGGREMRLTSGEFGFTAVECLYRAEVVSGDNNLFNFKNTVTRAELCEITYNYIKSEDGSKTGETEGITQ